MDKKTAKQIGQMAAASLLFGALPVTNLHAYESAALVSYKKIGSGTQVRGLLLADAKDAAKKDAGEGKCGEGKCGADKKETGKKTTTAKDKKADKPGDRKLDNAKSTEGKCGEGKCG